MKRLINDLFRRVGLNLSAFTKDTFKVTDVSILTKSKKIKMEPLPTNVNETEKNKRLSTLIWLDDRINPLESRMDWLTYSPIGRKINVIWVRDFSDFKEWICANGLPDAICFDYDLGENSPTGYDCAKWLIDYCQKNRLSLPLWSSQSTNPEGKARMNRLLRNNVFQAE